MCMKESAADEASIKRARNEQSTEDLQKNDSKSSDRDDRQVGIYTNSVST